MDVILHRSAPWNDELHAGNIRYTQVGDRKYTASPDGGVWNVWVVDAEGLPRDADGTFDAGMFVVIAFNLAQVRAAIDLHGAGQTTEEIQDFILAMPRVGTGRNHPRNVARRRGR